MDTTQKIVVALLIVAIVFSIISITLNLTGFDEFQRINFVQGQTDNPTSGANINLAIEPVVEGEAG